MVTPPAPIPGSGGGAGTISVVTDWIKEHYLEIMLVVLGTYVLYYVIVEVSKYIFKPASLVNPERGTKRAIGRVMYSKVTKGEKNDEFRAFIKDGIFGSIIPHLFVDMSRVKVHPNAVMLDYRAVVYDHERHMFVGSLTGAEDRDLDGGAVEVRTKAKLSLTDVLVASAVKSCPSISQFSLISGGIPISDDLYRELPAYAPSKDPPALPGEADGPDHVATVLQVKQMKEEMILRPEGGRGPPRRPVKKRFVVRGKGEDMGGDGDEKRAPTRSPEPKPSPADVIDSMPFTEKITGLFKPALSEFEEKPGDDQDDSPPEA